MNNTYKWKTHQTKLLNPYADLIQAKKISYKEAICELELLDELKCFEYNTIYNKLMILVQERKPLEKSRR